MAKDFEIACLWFQAVSSRINDIICDGIHTLYGEETPATSLL